MEQARRIGLICSYSTAHKRGMLRGIKNYALTRHRWALVPFETDTLQLRVLRHLHCDGVIADLFNPAVAEVLLKLGRPLVNVASVLPDLPFPRVGVNLRLIGELAAAYFLERGLRHFGYVGHQRYHYSIERETGYRQALSAAGYTLTSYYESPTRPFRSAGLLLALARSFQQWLQSLPRPVGLLACHDVGAFQSAEACRLTGLRVPEDVAILGVGNDDLQCEMARPSLSSIATPGEAVGYQAAALLDRLLAGSRPPRRPLLLPPLGVVTRQSTELLSLPDADVVAAVRFIRNHAHEPLRVEDVLREVPVSRRSLEQRFHRLLGRGPWEEIRRVHVQRAKDLLATSGLSISEVAQAAGFPNVQRLSRVFHADTGLTPTAYRRQFRGQSGV